MTAALLQVDPGLRIFHRNGTFFAGRLSGTMRVQRISPPDLTLLSMLLAPGNPAEQARGLVEGRCGRLFPVVPPLPNVLARIAHLRDTGLLVESEQQSESGASTSTLQDCEACTPIEPGSAWRLSANFLLQPTPAGFALSSAVLQQPVVLDIELVLLLTGFGAGRPAREVVAGHPAIASPDARLRAIAWLAERRLLLPHKAASGAGTRVPQPAAFAINKSSGPAPAWQALQPDERVPVYFVPHMENHYPLALGMIASALRAHNDGELMRRFRLLPITYMSPQALIDALPSPYLEGVFDDYAGRVEAAIVETNRGCPFACTFYDWGSATNGKIAKFEQGRVRDEIEWIGRNKVRVLWIADANFGMLPADLDFAAWVVEIKRRYGFPQEVVVNYTKNANTRLADIIRIFSAAGIVSQGIISIQTTDEETLRIIDRQNIKTSKYDELLQVFADAGLPLSTDLMIGLPGATVESFARDLQRYLDVDVSVKAYPTQLLPNSPMAAPEYREKYRIEVDADDFVVACHSFTREDLARMKALNNVYLATEGYGALRFVYRFLQWDRGIQATDVMQVLVDQVAAAPDDFPAITWVMRFFAVEKHMPGGRRAFYDEVADFVNKRWGIGRDSAFDTVLRANELSMPDDTRSYPLEMQLPHDIVAWFRAHGARVAREAQPLASYPPGSFAVDDPDGLARIDREHLQYDSHQYFWELRSPIARICSTAGHSQGVAA